MDEIVWEYVGKGEFIDGVPARSLTQQDVDWLHEDLRTAVEHSKLYRRAKRPNKTATADPEIGVIESAGADFVIAGSGRAGGAKGKKE